LEDGVNGNVRALALNGRRLFTGGIFSKASGKASSNLGVYQLPSAQAAPAPQLVTLSPDSALAGEGDFMITVSGSSFSSRSVVRWNGVSLQTTYVNGTQLRAAVPAARIAQAGSASVTVFTPAPSGGGESTSRPFGIQAGGKIYLPLLVR
jgi:hypothetical protein